MEFCSPLSAGGGCSSSHPVGDEGQEPLLCGGGELIRNSATSLRAPLSYMYWLLVRNGI